MSFSYDNTLATSLDQIRNLIQDTDPDDYDFEDEEISALYLMNDSKLYKTGAELVLRLSIKYSKAPSKIEVDGVRLDNPKRGEVYADLYDLYNKLAKKEALLSGKLAPIHFSGIERERYNEVREDKTLVRPRFTRDEITFSKRFPQTTPINKEDYFGDC